MLRKLLLILAVGMMVIVIAILTVPHLDVGSYILSISLVLIVVGSLTGMLGGYIYGRERGRPITGILLGALMSWLGWVILALIPPGRQKEIVD